MGSKDLKLLTRVGTMNLVNLGTFAPSRSVTA